MTRLKKDIGKSEFKVFEFPWNCPAQKRDLQIVLKKLINLQKPEKSPGIVSPSRICVTQLRIT